jgi:hypothetical protein
MEFRIDLSNTTRAGILKDYKVNKKPSELTAEEKVELIKQLETNIDILALRWRNEPIYMSFTDYLKEEMSK